MNQTDRQASGGDAMPERVTDHLDDTGGWHRLHLHHTVEELRAARHHLIARFHDKLGERRAARAAGEQLTLGQRVADGVATTMGSWRFIIIQSIILLIWITLNVVGFVQQWDSYPF